MRVHRHEPAQDEHAEVNNMFERMHRNTGPGSGIDVAMMQFMHDLVNRLPVHKAMHAIKMKVTPEKHAEQANHEINLMFRDRWYRQVPISV